MRLKEGSTLGEGSPALGKGRTRRTEFQLYDEFVSMTDGPLVEFKVRKRQFVDHEIASFSSRSSFSNGLCALS